MATPIGAKAFSSFNFILMISFGFLISIQAFFDFDKFSSFDLILL